MSKIEISGNLIKDSSIQRRDLDTTSTGQAVISKVIAGSGIVLESTGADSGTGDVTITAAGAEFQNNNAWIKWRNAENISYLDTLKVDEANDLIINAESEQIHFTFQKQNALTLTNTKNLKFYSTDFLIQGVSSDGHDDQSIVVTPSNATELFSSRGGSVSIFGNEHLINAGNVLLESGTKVGSKVSLHASATNGTIELSVGSSKKWSVDSSGHFLNDATSGGHIKFLHTGYGIRSNGIALSVGSETSHPLLLSTDSQTRLQILSTGEIAIGSSSVDNCQVQVTNPLSTRKGFVVRGATGQSANVLELQNNSGDSVFSVSPSGLVSLNNQAIQNVGTPVSPNDAATKAYVDAITFPMDVKDSCRVASTTNLNIASELAAGSVIDGVTLATGDRVLVKNQTNQIENGIYLASASGAASRSPDADTTSDITSNMFVFIAEGATQSDTQWVLTTNNPITLGTTQLVFAQFGQAPGVGISTLNSLSVPNQSLATGSVGTDFNIASAGSTHTFNLPDASATARGLINTGAQTIVGRKTFSPDARPTSDLNYYRFTGAFYQNATSNGTRYSKAVQIESNDCPISLGAIDAGYRISLCLENYFNTANFAGNLSENTALWARSGTDTSAPSGTITNAIAVKAQILKGANATHTNSFGFYEYSADPNSKNYFQSPLGINTLSPSGQFHVVAKSASTKGVVIQAANAQSAPLIDVQNNSGSSLFTVDATGSVTSGTVPSGRVTGLSSVATSGSYNDLSNKPSIPTTLSSLTGDVTVSNPVANDVLQYNGSRWTNSSSGGMPSGTVTAFAGISAPSGWLMCDGSAVNRTAYNSLFATIGTLYGAGDGLTTFNVPDLRSRMPVGKGASVNTTLGATDGVAEASRSLQHSHNVTVPAHHHAMGSGADLNITSTGLGNTANANSGISIGSHNVEHTHAASDSGHAHGVTDPGHVHEVFARDGNPNTFNSSFFPTWTSASGATPTRNTKTSTTGLSINTGVANISVATMSASGYSPTLTHSISDSGHFHSLSHTHGSSSVAGRIGLVTGGVDGNVNQSVASAASNSQNYIIMNYIIKI